MPKKLINTRILTNLGYSLLQANIIITDYLNAVSEHAHRAQSNWQNYDLIALVLVHIFITAIAFLIFNSIKSKRIRSLLPFYYLIGYTAHFLGVDFLAVLIILVLISIDLIYKRSSLNKIVREYRKKVFSAVLAMSIFLVGSQYLKIIFAEKINHVCSYSNEDGELVESNPRGNFIFIVFDKLSYQELYLLNSEEPGNISNRFSNFQDFSNQAWNFHASFSPYTSTMRSIPIIMGLSHEKTIADFFKDQDYKTYVFGNYINYCDLLPNLTRCESYSWYHIPPKIHPIFAGFLRHLAFIPSAGHHFYRHILFNKVTNFLYKRRGRVVQKTMEKDFLRFLESKPSNSFIYAHFNVPHPPYVFNKEGGQSDKTLITEALELKKIDKSKKARRNSYLDNLDYADQFLAKIIQTLENSGIYDSSTILITADHSYQNDPALKSIEMDPEADRFLNKLKELEENKDKELDKLLLKSHVPLFIKFPNQKTRQDSRNFVSNANLFPNAGSYSLFNEDLFFDSNRIQELGDNLIRVPKKRGQFLKERIENKNLVVKD